ncbi:MAG: DUF6049 family protein [Actinomycetota bacterium]
MRRLLALLATVLLLLPTLPARAQGQDEVRLTLMSQTPFATPDRPLRMRVRAVNETDQAFENLSISLWIYPAARSRSEYAQSLEFDAPTGLDIKRFDFPGTLEPGSSRVLSLETGLGELTDRAENALYPLRVLLESDFTPIAVLRTPLAFIYESPKLPLNVGLTFLLDAPMRLLPDGTFSQGALEAETGPNGPLETIVGSLEAVPVQATLVVSPLLLLQLQRMSDGYAVAEPGVVREVPANDPRAERAGDLLARIQGLARDGITEVVALPYASPSVPAMVESGLVRDLERQIDRGRAEVERILGVPPSASLFRPPGSALTGEAVGALADLGIDNLLVDAWTLPPPVGFRLTPPPTATLGAGGGRRLIAITPDPVVAARMTGPPDNAALRAQWVLGELTAVWNELPSVDRGVAVVIDAADAPERRFLRALLSGIGSPPPRAAWLRPVKATRLVGQPDPDERRDLDPTREAFSDRFVADLSGARAAVEQFTTMADESTGIEDRMQGLLLIAQHRGFLARDSEALAYLRAARSMVQAEFAKVEPPPATSVTLASRNGVIPVTIRSVADYEVRVVLRLLSSKLEFLEGNTREIVLSRPAQQFTFPVRAKATGRSVVRIVILTPGGTQLTESRIVVRSTAYNVVALVLTVGAAVFLAALWARRFLPRRT